MTKNSGKGYFEDRRPAANLDPYIVTAALVDVTVLGRKHLDDLKILHTEAKKELTIHE